MADFTMPESEGSRRRSQRLSRALPCGRWIFLFFSIFSQFRNSGRGGVVSGEM